MSWPAAVLLGRCVLAGLCIAASVPPWGWWPLAFVGIALLDRLHRRTSRGSAGSAARGWWPRRGCFPALFWMWDLTAPGYVVAGALYAAYFGVAAALVPAGPRPAGSRCPARSCWPRSPAGPSRSAACRSATWP